jgi:hypothetical protein
MREHDDTQHGSITETESAQDSTDEAAILLNDTEAFALLTEHFIATEAHQGHRTAPQPEDRT